MILTYLIPNRSRKGGRTPIVDVVPDLGKFLGSVRRQLAGASFFERL